MDNLLQNRYKYLETTYVDLRTKLHVWNKICAQCSHLWNCDKDFLAKHAYQSIFRLCNECSGQGAVEVAFLLWFISTSL